MYRNLEKNKKRKRKKKTKKQKTKKQVILIFLFYFLSSDQKSFFHALLGGNFPVLKDSKGYLFIDRNGKLFEPILDYLRSGTWKYVFYYYFLLFF